MMSLKIMEPSKITEIVTAWCFLGMVIMMELTLPVLFGYMMDARHLTFEGLFVLSSQLIYWVDKLSILLLGYCATSTIFDFLIPNGHHILNAVSKLMRI